MATSHHTMPGASEKLLRWLALADREGFTPEEFGRWWGEDGEVHPAHQGLCSRKNLLALKVLVERGLVVHVSKATWKPPRFAEAADADLEGMSEAEAAWIREVGAVVSEGPFLPYVVTPEGHAALDEIELRELEAEPDEKAGAEPSSWLDRLRVSIARRGTQYSEDGRRRWTIKDVAADAGVHRSTLARSSAATALLRAARTARTRAGHAESEGDHL